MPTPTSRSAHPRVAHTLPCNHGFCSVSEGEYERLVLGECSLYRKGTKVKTANVWRRSSELKGGKEQSKLTFYWRGLRPPPPFLVLQASVSDGSHCMLEVVDVDQTKWHWQVPCAHIRCKAVCETGLSNPSARSCKTGKRTTIVIISKTWTDAYTI